MRVQQELDETKIVLVRAAPAAEAGSSGRSCGAVLGVAAQDDRVRARARREAQRPRRPLAGAERAKQDVLQDSEEGACFPSLSALFPNLAL